MTEVSISFHWDNIIVALSIKIALRELKGYWIDFNRHDQASGSHNFPDNSRSITRAQTDFEKPMSSIQT